MRLSSSSFSNHSTGCTLATRRDNPVMCVRSVCCAASRRLNTARSHISHTSHPYMNSRSAPGPTTSYSTTPYTYVKYRNARNAIDRHITAATPRAADTRSAAASRSSMSAVTADFIIDDAYVSASMPAPPPPPPAAGALPPLLPRRPLKLPERRLAAEPSGRSRCIARLGAPPLTGDSEAGFAPLPPLPKEILRRRAATPASPEGASAGQSRGALSEAFDDIVDCGTVDAEVSGWPDDGSSLEEPPPPPK
mmetsp:Transcript_39459/g.125939  ORF Transcript_39459/g.125939 Transcript_39459/m.125939 type:complete len:250 (+) Transcript_39459:212-961(+)